jgi:hypothetical protein
MNIYFNFKNILRHHTYINNNNNKIPQNYELCIITWFVVN